MTAQIPDFVDVDGDEFAIAGVKGSGLFDPNDYGLKPRVISTACWRGFVAHYGIDYSALVLRSLLIGFDDPPMSPGEPFRGLRPTWDDREHAWRYSGVDLRVRFGGAMLCGRDFIPELYAHMGFHPAWKYRRVLELRFEDGRLLEQRDLSSRFAELRERLSLEPLRPGPEADAAERQRWIDGTFSLDYDERDL